MEEGGRPVLKAVAVRSDRMRVKACLEALAALKIDDLDKSSFRGGCRKNLRRRAHEELREEDLKKKKAFYQAPGRCSEI